MLQNDAVQCKGFLGNSLDFIMDYEDGGNLSHTIRHCMKSHFNMI